MIKRSIVVLLAGWCGLFFWPAARAEVVYHRFTHPTNVIFIWPGVDFDADEVPELSFSLFALGHESGGVLFSEAHGSANTEILLQAWDVLPLNWGDSISSSNSVGEWSGTGFGSTVWMLPFYSGGPVIVFTPGGGISTNPPPQPPPGQGVGMPGYGNFLAARFLLVDGWHYGWVRFSSFAGSFASLPSILDFAYETNPDMPILAGAGIDTDGDGVWDLSDQCSDTPAGEAVNADGCSISQLVPCEGPWKNHGEYVARIVTTVAQFQSQRLITKAEAREIVHGAARSDCGKQRAPGPSHHGRIDGGR